MDERVDSMGLEIAGMQRVLEIRGQKNRECARVEELPDLRRVIDQHIRQCLIAWQSEFTGIPPL